MESLISTTLMPTPMVLGAWNSFILCKKMENLIAITVITSVVHIGGAIDDIVVFSGF